jgi:hypothetical protein
LAPEHQLYWAVRCLKDYSAPPSRRNIDAVCPEIGDWFAEAVAARGAGGGVTDKLRWATMGYHHNWDTKVNILCIKTGEHSGRYFFVFGGPSAVYSNFRAVPTLEHSLRTGVPS